MPEFKQHKLYENNSLAYALAKKLSGEQKKVNSDRASANKGCDSALLFFTINLLGKAISEGHVCLALENYQQQAALADLGVNFIFPDTDSWLAELHKAEAVNNTSQPYLSLHQGKLYLQKYATFEQELTQQLLEHAEQSITGDFNLPVIDGDNIDWQQVAANNAVYKPLSIVVGGPGTGKTTTVIKMLLNILAALTPDKRENYRLALAAPTGKAATRLMQALSEKVAENTTDNELNLALNHLLPESAQTLHRLLGFSQTKRRFLHDEKNPLALDCLIVDEVSMIDMAMFCRLLRAVPKHCRLILLGDPYQLASVQAGNVLYEICSEQALLYYSKAQAELLQLTNENTLDSNKPLPALSDNMTFLRKSYRFNDDKGIGLLANALLNQDQAAMHKALGEDEIHFYQRDKLLSEEQFFATAFAHFKHVQSQDSLEQAFATMADYQLLCATKQGRYSTSYFEQQFYQRIDFEILHHQKPLYKAMPVMMMENNYQLDLYNGDMGLVWPVENRLYLFFPDNKAMAQNASKPSFKRFLPSQLTGWHAAHAITVHKSQGSEFKHVALAMPDMHSPLLTREMFYTAVTRAKEQFDCFAAMKELELALSANSVRHSGLAERLQAMAAEPIDSENSQ
jgi:exodeoxyribonuclease V alpha subunit